MGFCFVYFVVFNDLVDVLFAGVYHVTLDFLLIVCFDFGLGLIYSG